MVFVKTNTQQTRLQPGALHSKYIQYKQQFPTGLVRHHHLLHLVVDRMRCGVPYSLSCLAGWSRAAVDLSGVYNEKRYFGAAIYQFLWAVCPHGRNTLYSSHQPAQQPGKALLPSLWSTPSFAFSQNLFLGNYISSGVARKTSQARRLG